LISLKNLISHATRELLVQAVRSG